jgi:hypothetical protein
MTPYRNNITASASVTPAGILLIGVVGSTNAVSGAMNIAHIAMSMRLIQQDEHSLGGTQSSEVVNLTADQTERGTK